MGDDPILEILIHEEPTASNRFSSGLILVRKTRSFPAMRRPTRPNQPETERCRKPPRRLFIHNGSAAPNFRAQTDDFHVLPDQWNRSP